jgi:uncharacterized protein (TIGR02217 family)
MSTAVFPSLPGIAFPVPREAIWDTLPHEATSGKETRVAQRSAPRWRWTVLFKVLRTQPAFLEFQTLVGFFNARQGKFDSFLYTDPYDNVVTGQAIGTGDGSTKPFQLVRAFGSFVETVLAPNVVSAVYLNGVVQSGGSYSVSNWGAAAPGVVTFTSAPGAGVAVTADFSYYWPVRFDDDVASFGNFMQNLYDLKKLSFISIK